MPPIQPWKMTRQYAPKTKADTTASGLYTALEIKIATVKKTLKIISITRKKLYQG